MSERPSIQISVDFGWLAMAMVIVFLVISYDCDQRHRKSEPQSLGVAISCHIGGPAFCPAVNPK